MASRALTKGECDIISNALFYYGQKLNEQARREQMIAARIEERWGDESKGIEECKERASELNAKALATANLDYFVRRYALAIASPLVLPEQA